MKISYKQFRLTYTESRRWDLSRILTKKRIGDGDRRNPKGEEYEYEEVLGYDMLLENCLKSIVEMDSVESFDNETVELKEYYSKYVECKNKLLEQLCVKLKIN